MKIRNLKYLCLFLILTIAHSLCAQSMGSMPMGGNNSTNSSMDSMQMGSMPMGNDNSTSTYSAIGVVEKIAPDRMHATIHHQAIPGYMMEMTMSFPVKDTNELKGIFPGDKITFTLVVSKTNAWVENIHYVGHSSETNAMPMQMNMSGDMPELKPGDMLPDGVLIAEDGRQVHFSDFRGQAVAFTFFFTRCPMPNYCPLMNRNFSAARNLVLAKPNAPTNWELISISFDPQYDTPQVLASYGDFYRNGNPAHWLFAAATARTLATVAPGLDLMIVHQGTSISHNLRTVVLDPQGRISRQFDGNQWTPQDLANALLNAASQ
jgi:protein SCO1/2